jgi:hypothetical protein
MAECLSADAQVLGRNGVLSVADLHPGCELVAGRAGPVAEVKSIRTLIASERQMVTLHVTDNATSQAVSITVTASHTVVVLKPKQARFYPVLASEIKPGDVMRTRCGELSVTLVDHDVLNVAVSEVVLKDTKSSFFTGMSGTDPASFIEVCGALAPVRGSTVELLHFQRCDKFRQIIHENPELDACRNELEESGYGTDLGALGFGNGKLLVRAGLAARTIAALQQRCHAGELLTSSHIVVSQEFKALVLEQVQRQAPRFNRIVSSEVLELGPGIGNRSTFIELSAASSSSSAVTQSSTDARFGACANPRKRSRQSIL